MANSRNSQMSSKVNDKSPKTNASESDTSEPAQFNSDIAFGMKDYNIYELLPEVVKRRVNALRKIQYQATFIEAEFFAEVHKLECKYHLIYSKLYNKRQKIIAGAYEPTNEESEFTYANVSLGNIELPETLRTQLKRHYNYSDIAVNVNGIPNFWLIIFKNVEILSDMVQPHDEPILKHLTDVQVRYLEKDPMGFILEFHFSVNKYFSNLVLTKRYDMRCQPDEDEPFSFEGPEIYKCEGCVINWYEGHNVTVRTVKKRQKHRSHGTFRTVTKTLQNDSFFNFFSPPAVPDDENQDVDDDTKALLTSDFEIGHYIREKIIPRAVLYYTGEALGEEDDEYEEDEESEEEETSESSSDNENENKSKPDKKAIAPGQMQPPECKQQ